MEQIKINQLLEPISISAKLTRKGNRYLELILLNARIKRKAEQTLAEWFYSKKRI